MAMRALSGFCILFLLLSASHVLPSTEAARILDENKAAGIDGEDVSSITYPPIIGPRPRRCARNYYRAPYGCPPPPPPTPPPPPPPP